MNLKQYIRGRRRGKAARDLEREALTDPFLHDAIDGYDTVPGDHSRRLENLRRRVSRSSLEKTDFRRLAGLVAGLLILFAINFFFNREEKVETIATDMTAERIPPAVADTVKRTDEKAFSPLIAEAEKKTVEQTVRSHEEKHKTSDALVARGKSGDRLVERSLAENVNAVPEEDEISFADEPKEEIRTWAVTKGAVAAAPPLAIAAHEATGVVTDESGEPLAGVAVQVKNSKTGVVTDLNGRFSIPVAGKDSLTFSCIGYDTALRCADQSSPMSVVLSENPMTLSELVVVKSDGLLPVGGWKKFRKYLKREMQLPTDTCRDVTGNVSLTFEVDTKGHPVNIRVLRSLCPSLDREAIRLLENGPAWRGDATVGQVDVRFE